MALGTAVVALTPLTISVKRVEAFLLSLGGNPPTTLSSDIRTVRMSVLGRNPSWVIKLDDASVRLEEWLRQTRFEARKRHEANREAIAVSNSTRAKGSGGKKKQR